MFSRGAIALIGVVAAVSAVIAVTLFRDQGTPVPGGLVVGNGRLEARQVDIAAKRPGRVLEIAVAEGDLVATGATLAVIETDELDAQLARAEAETDLAREAVEEARAVVLQRVNELNLADHELERTRSLADQGHVPHATMETRETARNVAAAAIGAARARTATAERQITAAEAGVRLIRQQIKDATLTAPTEARVLYRLVAPGEIAAAGEPILTLLDLDDVYMEVFLPALDAGRLALGAEARIVLDVLPEYAIPAVVSFVSPEAQFTPKQVETLEEREKLVFRVRVRIPPDLVKERVEHVKTGLRGVAYIKLTPSVEWPERLQQRMPPELFE